MSFATALSPSDLKAQFARFKALYGTFGAPGLKDDATLFTQAWWNTLKRFNAAEVEAAVTKWTESTKDKWPNPGQLAALIFEMRGERNAARVSKDPSLWDENICPCGCRWNFYLINRPDGTTTPRWVQGCRAQREGLQLARNE